MLKRKISLPLFFAFIISSYIGYIIYQYLPNKSQSITSFCVSNATLQQWSEFFHKNDDKYTVRLLPDKNEPDQDLLFNSEQVKQIKQIKSNNPTVELLYEHNSNNKPLFYFYHDKIYTGVSHKCTSDVDSINTVGKLESRK